jgi:hypothetical protein
MQTTMAYGKPITAPKALATKTASMLLRGEYEPRLKKIAPINSHVQ